MTLYSDLVGKLEELHDPDEDISAHREAMRALNHLWPTIAVVERQRDALARLISSAYDAAALEMHGFPDTDQGDA